MSVQELHARIEKLSSEIQLQKDSGILIELERDKRLIQRQLNAVLDPVARLPVEISSEIFLQSLSPFPEPSLRHSPMLLLNICNAWSDIALSTPELWAAIDIVFPRAPRFEELLEIWLHRAGHCHLSVSLRGEFNDEGFAAVAVIVWRHGQQLRNLKICDGHEDHADEIEDDREVDIFAGIIPGPLPSLKTLKIHGSVDGRATSFSRPQILELLRLAPNLIQCIFHDVHLHGITPPDKLVLPALRRLAFLHYESRLHDDDALLQCLSLPGINALTLSLMHISHDRLFSFLERSSPPLHELVLGAAIHWVMPPRNSVTLRDCLRLVPSLTRFEVRWAALDFTTGLLTELAESTSLLPDLRDLTICKLPAYDITRSFWEILHRAVSARRTQLRTFQVGVQGSEPPVDILSALRELTVDGMQMHIGTQNAIVR
ncbi:F-box domain-containing protein [Mycena venus]|uniref:F-box domain-containing protein n=1 Tax=Mycena venus TaxID=2733690 RepID=A0A8H6U092_9AGAR|nr:F-box domain-containing protein [Mycena venus]